MKALIVIFVLGMVVTSTTTADHHSSQSQQLGQLSQWTSSVNNGKDTGNPRLVSVIGNVQKMLDDRHIGINLLSGRYELSYKRTY